MPVSSRAPESIAVAMARLGFSDPRRALTLLEDPAITEIAGSPHRIEEEGLSQALAAVPDPDGALLSLVRFMEVVRRDPALTAPVTRVLQGSRRRLSLLRSASSGSSTP